MLFLNLIYIYPNLNISLDYIWENIQIYVININEIYLVQIIGNHSFNGKNFLNYVSSVYIYKIMMMHVAHGVERYGPSILLTVL